jgi:hypothetical protein
MQLRLVSMGPVATAQRESGTTKEVQMTEVDWGEGVCREG